MAEWKVGELARRTGLTVRTLHHYDEIGLLRPTRRSAAGYRLYGEDDVARLHRIVSLKQLGFSLEDVREYLLVPRSLARVLELQIERLRQRIEAEGKLCVRLEAIAERAKWINGTNGANGANGAAGAEAVSAEELLQAIEATIMFEKYYTPEQMQQLDERRKQLGEEHIKAVEAEWPQLIARVKDCMARGVEPTSEEMLPLARRWKELVREFTGGDPGIARSVTQIYQNEPSVRERTGLDTGIMQYVGKAMVVLGGW
ncbi:MAG TPA: MerR family transcriptional regulator [Longimicrobiales bacterium]